MKIFVYSDTANPSPSKMKKIRDINKTHRINGTAAKVYAQLAYHSRIGEVLLRGVVGSEAHGDRGLSYQSSEDMLERVTVAAAVHKLGGP
jgi:hypothetical protein